MPESCRGLSSSNWTLAVASPVTRSLVSQAPLTVPSACLAGKKIAIYPAPTSTTGPSAAAYQKLPDMLRSADALLSNPAHQI